MNCLQCTKEIVGYGKKFCSQSCAGTYNNIHFPKRSKEKESWPKCKVCNQKVYSRNAKHCRDCISEKKHLRGVPAEQQTIRDCIKRNGSNRYDLIRQHAQRIYKNEKENPQCEHCSYTKYIEICHRVPVSSFSLDTTIEEVNKRENVLFLCPNCHWEFDHLKVVPPIGIEPIHKC